MGSYDELYWLLPLWRGSRCGEIKTRLNVSTVCRGLKKNGRCGEAAVSGGSTVLLGTYHLGVPHKEKNWGARARPAPPLVTALFEGAQTYEENLHSEAGDRRRRKKQ